MTPGYRLVVAANRDEFLSRPTAPLNFIDREKTILAGQDRKGGGTWLGISAKLQFAAITNYREPTVNLLNAPSRGEILLKYLAGNAGAETFSYQLAKSANQYNGFNLILGDSKELYYYSNRAAEPRSLAPGFYGLCNHLLDTPWPKLIRGNKLLYPHMVDTDKVEPERLFELLEDNWTPPDSELPNTGVALEWERILGSIFIDSPSYGTRSSAVIAVTNEGEVEFTEKTFHRSDSENITSELIRYSLSG